MPLHPLEEGLVGLQRQVELVAVVRNEREAEQRAADPIIFGVEEVPQRCRTAVQSSAGSGLPLRQRSWRQAHLLATFLVLLAKLAAALLVRFLLARRDGVDTGGGDLHRKRDDIDGSAGDGADDTAGERREQSAGRVCGSLMRTLQKLAEAAMTDQRAHGLIGELFGLHQERLRRPRRPAEALRARR